MKRVVFRLLELGVGLLILLLTAEVLVRYGHFTPRRELFRLAKVGRFDELDGVEMWPDSPFPLRVRADVMEDVDCDPDGAFRVMVVGDSIFNGIQLEPPQVASVRLKARIAEAHPGVRACVKNLAIPGYSLYQGLARARHAVPTFEPHVLLMELWGGMPPSPVRVGDTIHFFRGQARDRLGIGNPWHVQPEVNRWLLEHSRLYEYALLAAPDDCLACRNDVTPHRPLLDGAVDLVRAHGGDVVTLMPARLDAPFDRQPDGVLKDAEAYRPWLEERGIANVKLWEALAGHDSARLAQSEVHLNADGQALLTEVFLAAVEPALQRWEAAQGAPAVVAEGTPPAP